METRTLSPGAPETHRGFFLEAAHGLLLAHPTLPRDILSDVLLAVLALLVRYAHVAIPIVSHYTFETLLLAFVMLLAGNMFRGL
jgi:hypothetical protein